MQRTTFTMKVIDTPILGDVNEQGQTLRRSPVKAGEVGWFTEDQYREAIEAASSSMIGHPWYFQELLDQYFPGWSIMTVNNIPIILLPE